MYRVATFNKKLSINPIKLALLLDTLEYATRHALFKNIIFYGVATRF